MARKKAILRILTVGAAVTAVAVLGTVEIRAAEGENPHDDTFAEVKKRCEEFEAAVKKAEDPVALAIPMARDRSEPCALSGIRVLSEHWEDPRVETTLSELAKGEPKSLPGGIITPAGRAYLALCLVEARKERKSILKGKILSNRKM